MAHFAEIDENNIVINVVVVPDDVEHRGEDYLANELGMGGRWLQTSYNTLAGKHKNGGIPLRKNYAGIGYTYDEMFDAFIPPKPYPNWKLDYQTYRWIPPVAKPETREGFDWRWSEHNQEWIEIEFPTEN